MTKRGTKQLENVGKRIRKLDMDFQALMLKVELRRKHFTADPSVSPSLAEPLNHITDQSDLMRQTWTEMKARLTENHFVVHARSIDDESGSEDAIERFEKVMNSWLMLVEERNGYTLQDAMSDGQIVDAYAVLHWRRANEVYPPVPDFEYMDELPEDQKQKERYNSEPEAEGDYAGKYKETDASLQKRVNQSRARAGCPYHVEVSEMTSWRFRWDQMGIAMGVHIRDVDTEEYDEALESKDLTMALDDKKLRIYLSRDMPQAGKGSPSIANQHAHVRVATIWTRDCWYEYVAPAGTADDNSWEFVDSGEHAWGRVPAAIVPAFQFNHPDVVWRYQPFLEGAYRRKPSHDRTVAIMKGLAEQIAIGQVFVTQTGKDAVSLNQDGTPVIEPGTDSANADVLPEGWDLRKLQYEMSQAFLEAVKFDQEEFKAAMPSTGIADISASTKPWAARIAAQMANIVPKGAMLTQERAMVEMCRSLAKDMSTPAAQGGLGGTMAAFSRDDNGKPTANVVSINSDEIKSLDLDVSIDPVSSVEQITKMQHGLEVRNDPLAKLSFRDFAEEYAGWPDPDERAARYDAEQIIETKIKPGLIDMKVAEQYGSRVVVGLNGQFVGMGGQQVPTDQVLGRMGVQRMAPQRPSGAGGGALNGAMNQATMPPLVDNNAQQAGAMPQPPLVGVG